MLYDHLGRVQDVYPDLSIRSVEVVAGHGQNNDVLIVNGDLVFRFPRYQAAIERLERQVWILDAVRSRVDLAVPDFTYRCFEPKQPGKVFVGYARLPSEPLWQSTFDAIPNEPARQAIADQLSAFLRQLHSIPVAELLFAEAATFDPLANWRDLYQRIQIRLFPHMRPDARHSVADHFETFLGEPRHREIRPVLVHGDLGGSNILFDSRSGLITGIIDFDSAGVDDPALDVAAARGFGLGRLARSYPFVERMAERVAFYAGTFALQEALFGIENGDRQAFENGIAAYR